MIFVPGLVIALGALWFALSGETAPLFVIFAGVSILLVLWLCAKLRIVDRNASPYHRIVQVVLYLVWLAIEVVKANIRVIRSILDPRRSINPALVNVTTTATTDLGRAMFANSITLTPGTVTVDINGRNLVVHALQEETSRAHSFAPMDERAARAGDGGKKG
jgi:multicomponent Na+:H+ antiporter subunit E